LSAGRKGLAKVYVRQQFRKTLQEFQLAVQLPNPATLQHVNSESAITDFAQHLTSAASLLRHPEAWDESQAQNAEPTSAELLSLAESIRANWKAEYERSRSERQRRGDRALPRHSAQLMIRVEPEPVHGLIDRVQQTLRGLEGRLTHANNFCAEMLRELGSEAHLGYCATSQVVQMVPAAFRALSSPRELLMAEDLIEKTKVPLLVTGPAGYGKTSFCKWNFLHDVQQLAESRSETVPVAGHLHINERRAAEESDIRTVIKETFPAIYEERTELLGELLEDGLPRSPPWGHWLRPFVIPRVPRLKGFDN